MNADAVLYEYWLHERVTWEIVTPGKPVLIEAKLGLTLVFEGWQFPMLPSLAVNNYYIILNVDWIHRLHYVWFQNNPCQVNICVCISYSVNSNAHTTQVRIWGEPYTHKFCTVNIFLNITHCQAISPVAKFHHVLGRGFMIQREVFILSSVSQPIRINYSYFTWKYNIFVYKSTTSWIPTSPCV